MSFHILLAVIAGYLLGSIPSAYLAGRLKKGVDIRKVGGGNMGALNATRELGPLTGIIVLLADVAKGAAAVFIAGQLALTLPWIMAAGFAAVIGHNWPVFLGFKGGKGAATVLGVMAALVPVEFGATLVLMIIVLLVTSNARLAIAFGLLAIPVFIWLFDSPLLIAWYSLFLALFLLLRSLPGMKEAMMDPKRRKNLFFDREHHFWQARKR